MTSPSSKVSGLTPLIIPDDNMPEIDTPIMLDETVVEVVEVVDMPLDSPNSLNSPTEVPNCCMQLMCAPFNLPVRQLMAHLYLEEKMLCPGISRKRQREFKSPKTTSISSKRMEHH